MTSTSTLNVAVCEADVLNFVFQDEKDFRDKLSSIYVGLNFSLDPEAAADSQGLQPILNYQTANLIEQKVFWRAQK